MGTVDYNLEGDSNDLVSALTQAVQALTAATEKSNEAKAAAAALAEEQKRSADATKKLHEQTQAGTKRFAEYAAVAHDVSGTIKAVYDWTKWLVEGMQAVIQRGLEARDALGSLITPEDKARLDDYAKLTDNLSVALDKAAAEVTASMAPELTKLTQILIGGAEKLGDFFDGLEDLRNSDAVQQLTELGEALQFIVTLGQSQVIRSAMDGLADAGADAADSLVEVKTSYADLASFAVSYDNRQKYNDEQAKKREAEARERARVRAAQEKLDAEDSARSRQESLDWLERIGDRELEIIGSTRRANAAATEARLAESAAEADAIQAAGDKIIASMEKQTDEFVKQQEARQKAAEAAALDIARSWLSSISDVADAETEHLQSQLEQNAELRDEVRKRLEGMTADTGSAFDTETLLRRKATEGELAIIEERDRQIRAGLLKAFYAHQAGAITQVLIDASVATMRAYSDLGPIGGSIAGAAIDISAGVQVGLIAAKSPPSYHDGGLGADEGMLLGALMRQGERLAVVNQRGAETIDRVNRDQSAARSGEVRLVLADAGRVVGELLAREASRPGSRVTAVGTGATNPYVRTR